MQKDDAERVTKAEASAKSFERKSKADAEEKQVRYAFSAQKCFNVCGRNMP